MDTTDFLLRDPLSARSKTEIKSLQNINHHQTKSPFEGKNKVINTAPQQGQQYFKYGISKESCF
jgi:hypothetical protein